MSGFGLWRRTGALPPPDSALSSERAHLVATHMRKQLELGDMWVFAGNKPTRTMSGPSGRVLASPFRRPLAGKPDSGAEHPERASYIGLGVGGDDLLMRITRVIAARLDDVVEWKTYRATIDGVSRAPAPADWIASMLLIGPRAREAYALQRVRRVLGPGRGGRERGNFPRVAQSS